MKRVYALWVLVFSTVLLQGSLVLPPFLGIPLAGAIACSFLRQTFRSVLGATGCIAFGELAFGLSPGAWTFGAGLAVMTVRLVMRQGRPDWGDCALAGLPIVVLSLISSLGLSLVAAVSWGVPTLLPACLFLLTGLALSRPIALYLLADEGPRSLR